MFSDLQTAEGQLVSESQPLGSFSEEVAESRDRIVGLLRKLKFATSPNAIDEESDLVQFVLQRAWACRNQFRGNSPGELGAWLNEVTRTVFFDRLRYHTAAKRRGARIRADWSPISDNDSLAALVAATTVGPPARAQRNELVDHLLNALELLSADQRFVVVHRFLAGQTIEKICEEFAKRSPPAIKSEKAVASLLERALSSLRRMMASEERGDA
jgi:RNA polymerase sigma factor (sigma-70 family)